MASDFKCMLYLYHRLEQAKHECLWYKCYVPHCLCRLIASQYKLENWISYIDSLGNLIMGKQLFRSQNIIFPSLLKLLKKVSCIFQKMGVVFD